MQNHSFVTVIFLWFSLLFFLSLSGNSLTQLDILPQSYESTPSYGQQYL